MKTTNILLGTIAVLLFLILTKNSSFSFITQANAQENKAKNNLSNEVLNVRIVSIDNNAIMNVAPKQGLSPSQALPVFVLNGLEGSGTRPIPVYQVNK